MRHYFNSLCYAIMVAAAHAQGEIEPSPSCETVLKTVYTPSTTITRDVQNTAIVTASSPLDLGTFTWRETVSSTSTLSQTLTKTVTTCTGSETITATSTIVVYTGSPVPASLPKRKARKSDNTGIPCLATSTTTIKDGTAFQYITANSTVTRTIHTEHLHTTVTSYIYGYSTWVMPQVTATLSTDCGPTATDTTATLTVTRDARCAPTALLSEYNSLGINGVSGPIGHKGIQVNLDDATDEGECCQKCVEAHNCANSAYDRRTWGKATHYCKLIFFVDWENGREVCLPNKTGLHGFVRHTQGKLKPGQGWHIGKVCGDAYGIQ